MLKSDWQYSFCILNFYSFFIFMLKTDWQYIKFLIILYIHVEIWLTVQFLYIEFYSFFIFMLKTDWQYIEFLLWDLFLCTCVLYQFNI